MSSSTARPPRKEFDYHHVTAGLPAITNSFDTVEPGPFASPSARAYYAATVEARGAYEDALGVIRNLAQSAERLDSLLAAAHARAERERLDTAETQRAITQRDQTIFDLSQELDVYKDSDPIAQALGERILAFRTDPQTYLDAHARATKAVEAEQLKMITDALTEQIKREEGAKLRKPYTPDEIQKIRASVRNTLIANGNLREYLDNLPEERRHEIARHVIVDLVRRAQSSLDKPEIAEEHIKTIYDGLVGEGGFARLVDDYVEEHTAEWRAEANRRVRAELDAKVDSIHAEMVAQWIAEWRDSRDGKRAEKAAQTAARDKWERATLLEVVEATNNEALAAALRAREVTELAKLEKDTTIEQLLATFTTEGVDCKRIPPSYSMTLILAATTKNLGAPRSNGSMAHGRSYVTQRRLILLSMGDGAFEVKDDNFADSTNEAERHLAIKAGTYIHLGNAQTVKGTTSLSQRLAYGVPAYYTTDADDPRPTPFLYRTAHIIIGDQNTRENEAVLAYSYMKGDTEFYTTFNDKT